MLECNHDLELLMNGAYPPTLKRRISGRYGHLDNATAARLLARHRLQPASAFHRRAPVGAEQHAGARTRGRVRRRWTASLAGSDREPDRRASTGGEIVVDDPACVRNRRLRGRRGNKKAGSMSRLFVADRDAYFFSSGFDSLGEAGTGADEGAVAELAPAAARAARPRHRCRRVRLRRLSALGAGEGVGAGAAAAGALGAARRRCHDFFFFLLAGGEADRQEAARRSERFMFLSFNGDINGLY